MEILVVLGIIIFLFGVVMLGKDPKKVEEFLNRPVIKIEAASVKFSKVIGFALLVFAIYLIYLGLTLKP